MKTRYIHILLAMLASMALSCKQDLVQLHDAPPPPPDPCLSATAGTLNLTKFVAIGNSYVAGFQAGALFTDGQSNSLAKIVSSKLACAGAPGTFNQPDIGSVNGYNVQLSIPGVINLGRLILYDPDGSGPRDAAPSPSGFPGSVVTCPSSVTTPPLPAPYNTADIPGPFTGNKVALNNFAVPLIYLGQALIKETGGPASANPYYNPLYARFASNPGTSTILGDALTAQGTFYLVWLGMDDVLLYAVAGADGSYPMTDAAAFTAQYNGLIQTMLGTNPVFKGVVGNIPNITNIPYFYTVGWNAITLDAATAATLTTNLAVNYNAFLDGMVGAGVITAAERDKRKLTYVEGDNGVLLTDEGLTDLAPYMAGPYAGLAPYHQARQATASDLIPLNAGSILGTCYGGSPQAIYGVSFPVGDQYALTTAEITAILTRTAQFNATIAAAVAASGGRLALADINAGYASFVNSRVITSDGVTIAPVLAPPAGAFSEDGLHPNGRGYAFTANLFIDAINGQFGSTIPHASLGIYSGTALPVSPTP